ncbi:DUF3159 domain-containing protein [Brachybacterium paraconglomeratum]|uniref:DUF3159 domain-containing protein n=1 Tax=Brachybacterium paraconglomeratum TaxID=173362 RepID=UPI0022E52FC2|nr:DUF3159 domain-containing protein [Brachybacterium paraconglomeratum]
MDTDKAESSTTEQIIEQMGGASGLVLSTVPVIALVVAHLLLPLMPTLAVALGAGAVLFVIRLARGEKMPSAIGSLLGVAVAAALVIWTGSVRDFFVIGIWAALAIFLPTAVSVVARRPLTGMIWNAVHGGEHAWREDRPTYRAHVIATSAIAVAHLAKFVVQQWLYVAESITALGIADTLMGAPLTIALALVVVWAFRRSTTRMRAAEARHEATADGPRHDGIATGPRQDAAADPRMHHTATDTATADLIDERNL